MSADEFIYSVINADSVGQLDLNVIANTLASTDALVRQIKAQQEENSALKEKIASLRGSALQIKQLYEEEVGKNRGTADREQDYIRQLGELEARTRDAENARVNAELREKETVAELERKLETSQQRYDGLAGDALRNAVLLAENGLLPVDQQARLRELRNHLQIQLQSGASLPEDLLSILAKKKYSRKKRKSDVESRDQATMTCGPAVTSTAVNTCLSVDLPAAAPPATKKTFADKATMYSSSTVTRSTCTSAFIRRVDVGVNYPEVVPKSIDDILRECVVALPSLLSPILDEIPVQRESIETQTDPPAPEPTTFATVGTNTTIRNIRRRLDYVRKTENLAGGIIIKKEETISPASSLQNLPTVTAAAVAAAADVNPQLTQIWALLGETMFRLLGNGRMFDSKCYNTINERLAMINSLIDPETRRGTQMMSEALAMLGEARKQSVLIASSAGPADGVPEAAAAAARKGGDDYEEDAVGEASNEPWDEDVALERLTPPQQQPEEPEDSIVHRNDQQVVSSSSEDFEDLAIPELSETVVSAPVCEGELENVPVRKEAWSNNQSVQPHTKAQVEQVDESPLVPALEQPTATSPSPPEETKESESCSIESPVLTPALPIVLNPVSPEHPPQPEEEEFIDHVLPTDDEPVLPDVQPPKAASALNRSLPAEFNLSDLTGCREKHYLEVRVGDDDSGTTDDEEADRMMIVEGSPARTVSASSSCTSIGSNGTLISPIKVRETNELVKDQFKTPTSPAISKRKLRERTESGSSTGSISSRGNPKKRGRLSPETESLLEDDWDRKLSRIKDYFALPSSLNPIESGAMWDEEEEEDSDEDMLDEFKMPAEPLVQTVKAEELKPSTSSQWDDFKVPLRIDIAEPPLIATTDSPESPSPEDSPMSPDQEKPASPMEAFGSEDSPMSPVAEASFSWDESPLSPPLQGRASMYSEGGEEPKVIPVENPLASRLSQDYSNTPIGKTVARYNNGRRAEVLRNMAPEMVPKDAGMLRRIATMIREYVAAEWTVENLQRCCTEVLAVTDNTRIISLAVMECAVGYQDFVLDVQCSPPAPPLPKCIQQLVLLVKSLNETLFTLDKVLLHELDRRVFTLKAGADKIMLESITAITYLYVGISDSSRLYGCTARLYIYKCLYYFNFKGLPLIYLVLKAFPHALPKKGSVYYDNSDAMVSTIRTVLMNINFMERSNAPDAHLYKKNELMKLFKYFYGYQPGQPTYDELITNLVEKIKANKLKNVDYCLILVAKRKGYEWAKDAIVQKHLYPLLNDYLKQLDSQQDSGSTAAAALDDRICCLIFSISAILKTQPNFRDVSRFMQMFGNIVQLADGHQRIQEAAVAGLVRFTRFGFADVYEWLCRWCPSYEVSGRTKLMLATFVHRKEARFWQQLNQREIV